MLCNIYPMYLRLLQLRWMLRHKARNWTRRYLDACLFYSTKLNVAFQYICGVTILRSGGALERGFRRVINDVPVGSMLIQSDSKSGEALLLQVTLPAYVRLRHLAEETYVFLLDAQVMLLHAMVQLPIG